MFNKKLTIYSIISISKGKVLTFVNSKKQIQEYLNRYFYLLNKTHFESWCELRNLVSDSSSSLFSRNWKLYYSTVCQNLLEDIEIETLKYDKHNLTKLFRLLEKCVPLGCSFDKEINFEI